MQKNDEKIIELLREFESAERAFAIAEFLRRDTEYHAKRADDAEEAIVKYVTSLRNPRRNRLHDIRITLSAARRVVICRLFGHHVGTARGENDEKICDRCWEWEDEWQ
jgi:hypothetical protein